MNRIERTFSALKSENRAALVTFISAGDPDEARSLQILKGLPKAGADIVELGMPFSDPMADGPRDSASSQRALKNGASMKRTLAMARAFRAGNPDTPLVLMGYLNPVLAYGQPRFITDAAAAGVDGLIIVDLPPEEDAELRALAKAARLEIIRLVTPTTDDRRLPVVLEGAGGFLYFVSIAGVTGTASADAAKVSQSIDMIRKYTDLPIAVGFGIKTPDEAGAIGRTADAVVVGSALVKTIEGSLDKPDIAGLVHGQVKAFRQSLSR